MRRDRFLHARAMPIIEHRLFSGIGGPGADLQDHPIMLQFDCGRGFLLDHFEPVAFPAAVMTFAVEIFARRCRSRMA